MYSVYTYTCTACIYLEPIQGDIIKKILLFSHHLQTEVPRFVLPIDFVDIRGTIDYGDQFSWHDAGPSLNNQLVSLQQMMSINSYSLIQFVLYHRHIHTCTPDESSLPFSSNAHQMKLLLKYIHNSFGNITRRKGQDQTHVTGN